MTIRDHLRKRRLVFWAALGIWFVLGLLIVNGPPIAQYAWFGVAAALLMGQFWFVRCTRCKSHIPTAWGVGLGKRFNPINFCAFCGVSLDEPANL